MKTSVAPIIKAFERYRFTYSQPERFSALFADRGDLPTHDVGLVVQSIVAHRSVNAPFYELNDYNWTCDTASYSSGLEAYLQLKMLRILADIRPDRAAESNLRGIAVRILDSGDTSPRAVRIDDFRYIVFPTNYTLLLREFLYFASTLIVRSTSITPSDEDRQFAGRSVMGAELARRYIGREFGLSMPVVLRFFSAIKRMVHHQPGVYEHPFSEGLFANLDHNDRIGGFIKNGAHWMEMFVLCHELVHLIDHKEVENERSIAKETDADLYALSLLKIHRAMCVTHDRQPESHLGYIYGPIFSVLLEFLVAEVRWTTSADVRLANFQEQHRSAMTEMVTRLGHLGQSFKFMNRGPYPGVRELDVMRLVGTMDACLEDMASLYACAYARYYIKDYLADPMLKTNIQYNQLARGIWSGGIQAFESQFDGLITNEKVQDSQILLTTVTADFIGGYASEPHEAARYVPLWRQGFM